MPSTIQSSSQDHLSALVHVESECVEGRTAEAKPGDLEVSALDLGGFQRIIHSCGRTARHVYCPLISSSSIQLPSGSCM